MAASFSFKVEVIPPKDNAQRPVTTRLENPCAQFLVPSEPTEAFSEVWIKTLAQWKDYPESLSEAIRLEKLTTFDNYDIPLKRTVGEYGYSAASNGDCLRLRVTSSWQTPSNKRFAIDTEQLFSKRQRFETQHSQNPFGTRRRFAASAEPPSRRSPVLNTNFEEWTHDEEGFRRPPRRNVTLGSPVLQSHDSVADSVEIIPSSQIAVSAEQISNPQEDLQGSTHEEQNAESTQVIENSQQAATPPAVLPPTPVSEEVPALVAAAAAAAAKTPRIEIVIADKTVSEQLSPDVPVSAQRPRPQSHRLQSQTPLELEDMSEVTQHERDTPASEVQADRDTPSTSNIVLNTTAITSAPTSTPVARSQSTLSSKNWSPAEDALMLSLSDTGMTAPKIVKRLLIECGEVRSVSSCRARRSVLKRRQKAFLTGTRAVPSSSAALGTSSTGLSTEDIDDSGDNIAVGSSKHTRTSNALVSGLSSSKAGPSSQAAASIMKQSRLSFFLSGPPSQQEEIVISSSPDEVEQDASRPRDKGKNAAVGRSVSYDTALAARRQFMAQKAAASSSSNAQDTGVVDSDTTVRASAAHQSTASLSGSRDAPGAVEEEDEFAADSGEEQALLEISQSSIMQNVVTSSASDEEKGDVRSQKVVAAISKPAASVIDRVVDTASTTTDTHKPLTPESMATVMTPIEEVLKPMLPKPLSCTKPALPELKDNIEESTDTVRHVVVQSSPVQASAAVSASSSGPPTFFPVEVMTGEGIYGHLLPSASDDESDTQLPTQHSWGDDRDVLPGAPLIRVDRDEPQDKRRRVGTKHNRALRDSAESQISTTGVIANSTMPVVDDASCTAERTNKYWKKKYESFEQDNAGGRELTRKEKKAEKRRKAAERDAMVAVAQQSSTSHDDSAVTHVTEQASSTLAKAKSTKARATHDAQSHTEVEVGAQSNASTSARPLKSILKPSRVDRQHATDTIQTTSTRRHRSKKERRARAQMHLSQTKSINEAEVEASYSRLRKAAENANIPEPPRAPAPAVKVRRAIDILSIGEGDASDSDEEDD